jgi:hypothetical protein
MSNTSTFLATFDSEADSLGQIIDLCISTHKVDPRIIYCLHTGKPIGTLDPDELAEAVYEEGDSDDESLADALVIRTVASMRPSPALNRPDLGTIREMVSRRPKVALAYLVNRLDGTRHLLTKRDDSSYSYLLRRVQTFQLIDSLSIDLAPWTHWLLELDSKFNLHDLVPPKFRRDKSGKLEFAPIAGDLTLADLLGLPDGLAAFESWVFSKLAEHEKAEKSFAMQQAWSRGNRMTGPAFVDSWLKNPEFATRKAEAIYNKKQKAKSATPRKSRVSKLEETTNQFLDLLEGVLAGSQADAEPAVTHKRMPVLRGNMLFAKKESNHA